MRLLEVKSLTVSIAGMPICDGLNIKIQRGESWAILGSNGAGKTTLLHTFAGLRPADEGQIYFSDKLKAMITVLVSKNIKSKPVVPNQTQSRTHFMLANAFADSVCTKLLVPCFIISDLGIFF